MCNAEHEILKSNVCNNTKVHDNCAMLLIERSTDRFRSGMFARLFDES